MALLEFACPFCKSTCIGKIASSEPLGRVYACLASSCIMQSKQGDGEDILCLQEQHWAEGVYCKCMENFALHIYLAIMHFHFSTTQKVKGHDV